MNQIPDGPANECSIEPLALEHVDHLAQAHCDCFPDFFLTSLGPEFVSFFYRCMARHAPCFAVVAVEPSGRVAGFAAGARSGDDLKHYIYRNHFLFVAWTLAKQFVLEPKVRQFLFSRLGQLNKAFRLVLRRSPPAPTPRANNITDPDEKTKVLAHLASAASLMSMGVRPEHRGTGLAERLILAFEEQALLREITCIELSTFKTNSRAIAFYEKVGYKIYNIREIGVDLFKYCE